LGNYEGGRKRGGGGGALQIHVLGTKEENAYYLLRRRGGKGKVSEPQILKINPEGVNLKLSTLTDRKERDRFALRGGKGSTKDTHNFNPPEKGDWIYYYISSGFRRGEKRGISIDQVCIKSGTPTHLPIFYHVKRVRNFFTSKESVLRI